MVRRKGNQAQVTEHRIVKTMIPVLQYSKNPYPLRRHKFPNEAITWVQEPQGRRPTSFWGPWQLRCWELWDFSIGIGSYYITKLVSSS